MTPEPLANPTRTRARSTPEQLILDLATMWLDRYDRASHLPRGNVFDPADPRDELWRATTAGIVDAWTVLYLLGLLRTHAPAVAEHAAEFLNVGAADMPGERMPLFVREWARAVEAGRSLLPLLP